MTDRLQGGLDARETQSIRHFSLRPGHGWRTSIANDIQRLASMQIAVPPGEICAKISMPMPS